MYRFIFCFLFLFLHSSAWAAVAIDQSGATDNGAAQAGTVTHSFTCANSNTLLLVGVSIRETTTTVTTLTDLTYNGLAIADATLVTSFTTPTSGTRIVTVYLYYFKPGAACNGSANNLVASLSVDKLAVLGALSLTGVDQTTPVDGAITTHSAGTPTDPAPCGSVTTETGDLVLCAIALRNSGVTVSAINNGTQTWQDVTTDNTPASDDVRGLGATTTGTGGQVIEYNLSTTAEWATAAVNINASVASTKKRQSPIYYNLLDTLLRRLS